MKLNEIITEITSQKKMISELQNERDSLITE